jgi:hypothetical protein
MNYCNRVKGFIDYALSNLKNISRGGIRYPCKRCRNKRFLNPDSSMKRAHENFFCVGLYMENLIYIPYKIMVEKIVGSTSTSSNVHEVVNDNSNPYKSMTINTMRMNQSYVGHWLIIDDEPNTDTTKFFELLKDFDKLLWDACTNHSKLSVIA